MSKILLEALSDKDSLRRVHRVKVLKNDVGSSAHRVEVGRDGRSLLELEQRGFFRRVEVQEPAVVLTR